MHEIILLSPIYNFFYKKNKENTKFQLVSNPVSLTITYEQLGLKFTDNYWQNHGEIESNYSWRELIDRAILTLELKSF